MSNNSDDSSAADPPLPFDPLKQAVPVSYFEKLERRAYFKWFYYPIDRAAEKLPAAAALELPKPLRSLRNLVCYHLLLPYLKTYHPKIYVALKNLRSFILAVLMATDSGDSSADVDPPPPFDPLKPGVPISYPLQKLEELESRAYFKSFHYPFNKSSVKLPAAAAAGLPKRPRNLVCHDMAGGYTDDKFVQGGDKAGAFAIWHWYLIDVFVYFSHNLVTLPPPCWTNTAHKHGVKVLGTFIMEWDEGKILAGKLLASKESVRMYADRLSELAVSLGFDGWLINMEVTLAPGQIPNLKEFISYLSQTMHSSLPGSLVIWYDSVTIDGDLLWQNRLNDKNKPFFDLCDGIFVNYSWEEDFPKLSANVAADRKFDVYMGIDVFGRGTYGGGQWNTNVALDVIKKDDVSAAIFAPGWVYETEQSPDFQTAQNRWWGLVEQSWGIVQNYPKVLPFYSNFDQGHGYHRYSDAKQISTNQWNNLSSQSFQPFIKYSGDSKTEPIQVSIDVKGASYSGGGSITFVGTLGNSAEFSARLFQGELPLGNSQLHFKYSVKLSGNSLLGLALEFSSATDEKKSVLLAAPGNILLAMNMFSSHFTSVVMPRRVTLEQEPGWMIQESNINMAGHILTEIRAVCYRLKPDKSAAVAEDHTLSHAPSDYYAVLGDVTITTDGENAKFPPSDSWHVESEFVSWTSGESKNLSAKIIWQLKVGKAYLFAKYNVFVEKLNSTSSSGNRSRMLEVAHEYLGEAVVQSFYVSGLQVPLGTSSLKFIIQVCGLDGASQKLEDAPFLQLKVED